jgi:hypothetical protein
MEFLSVGAVLVPMKVYSITKDANGVAKISYEIVNVIKNGERYRNIVKETQLVKDLVKKSSEVTTKIDPLMQTAQELKVRHRYYACYSKLQKLFSEAATKGEAPEELAKIRPLLEEIRNIIEGKDGIAKNASGVRNIKLSQKLGELTAYLERNTVAAGTEKLKELKDFGASISALFGKGAF